MRAVRWDPRARLITALVAAAAVVVAADQSLAGLQIVASFAFGVAVARYPAVLFALLPFLVSIAQGGGGDGDPPGWVAGLFFEMPVFGLIIAAGVACSRLVARRRSTEQAARADRVRE